MKLSRSLAFAAVAWTLTFGAASAIVPPPLPTPVATFDVGSLHVAQYGSGPRALVFIPGLTCGPWEWSGQIDRFSAHYTVYALTLPGTDGRPPIAGPLFQTVTADFWTLLAQHHIAKPVVIGHSLGGTLGFMLAEQHPELLAGVVALDGLPILPSAAVAPRDQLAAQAAQLQAQIASANAQQFEAGERAQLAYLIQSPSDVEAVLPLVARSDPGTTARWLGEDLLLDLRPQLASANVPILLLAPYDASVDGFAHLATIDAKQTFYASLVKGAPDVHVVMIPNSRHFAMYDQPQAVTDDIAAFLSRVSP